MTSTSEVQSETARGSESGGITASLLVGLVMVCVYLASAALDVYERVALNSFYPDTSQFAFLRSIFPSPAASAFIAWQDILLFELVPFVLFFYLAVRMRIDPTGKILPTLIAAAIVGAALSVLNSVLAFYQPNISHFLLAGSFAVPNVTQGGSPLVVSLFSAPWILLGNGALFAALGLTGISFGSFSGETPYWIVRRLLDSSGRGPDEEEDTEDSPEGADTGHAGPASK